METIRINKNEIRHSYSECRELKEIIKKLEVSAQTLGKVVCSVSVNGLKLSETDEFRFAATSVNDIEEIEVQLSKTDSVFINSVSALRDFLLVLKKRTLTAAEHYREHAITPEQHVFSEIVQLTQLLADSLLAIKPRFISLAIDEKKQQDIWATVEAHFMQSVSELAAAYEKQDFVLVSDVLEYELQNSIDKWLEVVSIDN